MATINLGKVITDEQKAVLDKTSYNAENYEYTIDGKLVVTSNITATELNTPFKVLDATPATISGLAWGNVYSKIVIKDGILWVVFSGQYTTSADYSPTYNTRLTETYGLTDYPDIMAKIFTYDGTAMYPYVALERNILVQHSAVIERRSDNQTYVNVCRVEIGCYNNGLRLNIGQYEGGETIINPSSSGIIDIRIPLLLV